MSDHTKINQQNKQQDQKRQEQSHDNSSAMQSFAPPDSAIQPITDNRPGTVAQRRLQELIDNSPQVQEGAQLQSIIDNSPRQVAQRKALNNIFGGDTAPVQRKTEEEEQTIQAKENNTGLPDNLKTGVENLSGMSMDDVKVHYSSARPRELNALAYAQGNDIHLGPGQEKHLPHEAWHVVQQRQGRVQPTMQMKGVAVNDEYGLEKEADVMGEKAAERKEVGEVDTTINLRQLENVGLNNAEQTLSNYNANPENYYRVVKNDSLTDISQKFNVSTKTLIEVNKDKVKTWGKVQGFNAGDKIVIPGINVPELLAKVQDAEDKTSALKNKKEFKSPLAEGKPKEVVTIAVSKVVQDAKMKELAIEIYKAIDGLGTDEETVYKALASLKYDQSKIEDLRRVYKSIYGVPLDEDIKGDFSGDELSKGLGYLNFKENKSEATENKETITAIKASINTVEASCIGKTVSVEGTEAYIRNDDLSIKKDSQGKNQLISKGVKVEISQTKIVDNKAYVFAKKYGWTSISNFGNQLLNETMGVEKAHYDSLDAKHKTVGDADTRLRGGGPKYDEIKGSKVVQGSYIIIKEESQETTPKGKFVKINQGSKGKDGKIIEGESLGWTAKSNLVDGWSSFKNENAKWEKGNYTGQADVYKIVGSGNNIEEISSSTLDQFLLLKNSAAKDGIILTVGDGFREFAKQQDLWNHNPNPKEVARPGKSNHQHGQALDLNTKGFDTLVYKWLYKNGPKYGWIRTVNKEHWHWEYRPSDAKLYGAKLPSIKL